MPSSKSFSKKGTVLIISVILLGLLLILGSYFLVFTLTEFRISNSQMTAAKTYYLAEAGVNEAIWRLKNDAGWKDNFETEPVCDTWSASFSRNDVLFPDSSYQVQIENSSCARGEIVATSTLLLSGGKTSQRVVKTKVFKAIGSLTNDSPFFSGGSSENLDISASILNIHNGNLFSNNHTNIKWSSIVTISDDPETEPVEGKALSVGNIDVSSGSTLNSTAKCGKNLCVGDCSVEGCPVVSASMPSIDFDSEDANSYKNKAIAAEALNQCIVLCNGAPCETKCLFTDEEFSDLLWQVGENGTLTLNNNVTYVTGSIDLKGGRRLVVNGTLVADGTVNIGEVFCWSNQGEKDCNFNQITVNDPGVGIPSGLLTKSKINFGLYSSFQNIVIVGLIYANDEIRLVSSPFTLNLTGGLLGRKISLTSIWSILNVYLDNTIILEGIWGGPEPPGGGTPPYSPIVTIEHWEESY